MWVRMPVLELGPMRGVCRRILMRKLRVRGGHHSPVRVPRGRGWGYLRWRYVHTTPLATAVGERNGVGGGGRGGGGGGKPVGAWRRVVVVVARRVLGPRKARRGVVPVVPPHIGVDVEFPTTIWPRTSKRCQGPWIKSVNRFIHLFQI